MNSPQIKLYGFSPQDRSGRVRWVLAELGIPFESHFLDWKAKEHQSDGFLKINPMGRVPAMEFNGQVLHESTSLCLFLADQYPGLAPAQNSLLRAKYFQWSVFPAASIEPRYQSIWSAAEQDKEAARVKMIDEAKSLIKILEIELQDRDFIVGNEFSTADILLSSCLPWADGPLLKASPILSHYFEKLKTRKGCIESKIFAEEEE